MSLNLQIDGGQAVLTLYRGEYTFGVMIQNKIQAYQGHWGKALFCGLTVINNDTDALIKLHMEWAEIHQNDPNNYRSFIRDIIQDISREYRSLLTQYRDQVGRLSTQEKFNLNHPEAASLA